MDEALAEYGYSEVEPGSVIEILMDDQNKDGVDELVTTFVEKIDAEVGLKDTAITKGIKDEHTALVNEITDSQNSRSRNIISMIIKTCSQFEAKMGKSFSSIIDRLYVSLAHTCLFQFFSKKIRKV